MSRAKCSLASQSGQCSRKNTRGLAGCLPFTWVNRSVHGLGKWYAKFSAGKFRPGIAFTICNKSVPFTKKRPRRPEPGIKNDFEKMEHKLPLGTFRPEKQDYLFKCSVAPGKFPMERPRRSCSMYFPTGFSVKFW